MTNKDTHNTAASKAPISTGDFVRGKMGVQNTRIDSAKSSNAFDSSGFVRGGMGSLNGRIAGNGKGKTANVTIKGGQPMGENSGKSV